MGTTGKKVRGRYSYVYVYENEQWMISHHHSSVMPESIVTAEPITELEVRGLFDKWDEALATYSMPFAGSTTGWHYSWQRSTPNGRTTGFFLKAEDLSAL